MSFHTKVSSITLDFRSFCIERSPVKHTARAAHNGAADRFENSPRFQRVFIAQEWRRLYTAAVFAASFASNNRIPVEFSWNWKETAVCRNRPIFLRSFVTPVTKSRRKDSRYDLYISTRLDTFSTTKISPCPRSIEISREELDKSARKNSSNHPCCSTTIRIYDRERERERGGNVKKLCSVKSKLRTSSILKSETKSSRLPTYLENVHLPSRLSPSAFDESRLDFRLGQDFFPVQGSRAAIQGWKNRADGLDGCRFS